ncbi:unnamed protein product [Cyprideis torosa]|uniref:Uncharacterized protein n=1 Tax=Cyprideis torosa TaxID=163714 RepID=A0A7R8ZRX4_9CRUS|nr:unnamed protein product [Cyprideis torosa]CAG0900151.1 unnamed protein product [Cyprideis torosa]
MFYVILIIVLSKWGSALILNTGLGQMKEEDMTSVYPLLPSTHGATSSRLGSAASSKDHGDLINKVLPRELLLRIFSYLDIVSLCRSAQVSRYWNTLALDGSNWQRVDLFNFQRDIEGNVVENLARQCGGFLKLLSLKGTLHSLGRHCPKLRHLDLSSCEAITDDGLTSIAKGCPLLESLNISWCDLITEQGTEAIARGCQRLKSVTARGCAFLTDSAICKLARYCPLLEVINLQGCRALSDRSIEAIGEHCHNLRYLCLSNIPSITDASLVVVARGCLYLTTLEVAGCSLLTDVAFQALAKNCHFLDKMDLEECSLITDSTLSHLAVGCPRLEKLSLSHCDLITDDGIHALGTSTCASEHLTVLELDNCSAITDAALEHLQLCHNLQRIDLYDCQLITRPGIKRLKNQLPNIRVHAYFAPMTPPPQQVGPRRRFCRCCVIL